MPSPKPRRWWQFSLRMLLAFMTLCALGLGYTMNYLHSLERQWDALARLEARNESRPDGSGLVYKTEPATLFGLPLPGGLNPKWRVVRSLEGGDFNDDKVPAELPALPYLVELEISNWHLLSNDDPLTDDDLKTLGSLRKLKTLSVYYQAVTGKFLAGGTLPDTVESLSICSWKLNNEGARNIGKYRHLKSLFLQDFHSAEERGGISDWSFLNELTELEDLWLKGDFSDDVLAALRKMPHLRILAVMSDRLTPKGVAEIAKCQGIEQLHIGLTLTDEISDSLRSMTNLKKVELVEKGIDPAALKTARPGLKITFRSSE